MESLGRGVAKREIDVRTTLPRAILALACAVVCGTLLSLLAGEVSTWLVSLSRRRSEFIPWDAAKAFVVAGGVVYLFGMVLVSPVWWRLDRTGYRHWTYACLTGAVANTLGFTMIYLIGARQMSRLSAEQILISLLILMAVQALTGALTGLLAWRIAYRRAPEAAEAF